MKNFINTIPSKRKFESEVVRFILEHNYNKMNVLLVIITCFTDSLTPPIPFSIYIMIIKIGNTYVGYFK